MDEMIMEQTEIKDKDQIFIAWTEENRLAIKVKDLLEQKGYRGVVGGQYERNPMHADTHEMQNTVNATVHYQMDRCSQAIIIFKKRNDNTISTNLIYEYGYLLAKFRNEKKMHFFEIDIRQEDRTMYPTDLQGIWGFPIISDTNLDAEASENKVAEQIVAEFLRKQSSISHEHKLDLINNYYRIEYENDYHIKRPLVSDNELAKKILYYLQAAYIFQIYGAAKSKLQKLDRELRRQHNQSVYLKEAIEYALLTIELFLAVKPTDSVDGVVNMSRRDFRRYLREYRNIAARVMTECSTTYDASFELENVSFTDAEAAADSFKVWMIAQMQQHVTFLHFVYLTDDRTTGDDVRIPCAQMAVKFGEAAAHNLGLLAQYDCNRDYANIHLAYAHRNLAFAYNIIGDEKMAKENQDKSFKERRDLYELVQHLPDLNPALKNYVSLEYFLQVVDLLESMNGDPDFDEDEYEDYMDEITNYIADKDSYEKARRLIYDGLHHSYDKLVGDSDDEDE